MNHGEKMFKTFENVSGWSLEDIYWKIFDLEYKLIRLEERAPNWLGILPWHKKRML